jgi:hypothetical protein
MKTSNHVLLMMLIPSTGRLVNTSGKSAQWMAQATEAAIPRAS